MCSHRSIEIISILPPTKLLRVLCCSYSQLFRKKRIVEEKQLSEHVGVLNNFWPVVHLSSMHRVPSILEGMQTLMEKKMSISCFKTRVQFSKREGHLLWNSYLVLHNLEIMGIVVPKHQQNVLLFITHFILDLVRGKKHKSLL